MAMAERLYDERELLFESDAKDVKMLYKR